MSILKSRFHDPYTVVMQMIPIIKLKISAVGCVALSLAAIIPCATARAQSDPADTPKYQNSELKKVTEWGDLNKPESWQNFPAEIVVPGSAGVPARVEKITGKSAFYQSSSGAPGYFLTVISDPETHFTYITRTGRFYLSAKSDLLACMVDASLRCSKSFFKTPSSPKKEGSAIQQFVTHMDEAKLSQENSDFSGVDLTHGAPFEFFTGGSGGGSQPGIPSVSAIDFIGGILQLDLLSPWGRYKGRFWIDLSAQKLLRSVVNGQEMNLSENFGGVRPLGHDDSWGDPVDGLELRLSVS